MAASGSTGRKQGSRSGSSNKKRSSRQTANRKRTAQEEVLGSKLLQEVLLIGAFALCVFLFLCNFGIMGAFGEILSNVLFGIFGLSAYIAPLLIFVAAIFYISNQGSGAAVRKLVSGGVLYILLSMLCELFAGRLSEMENYSLITLYKGAAENHNGGGALAGSFAYLSYHYLEMVGTVLLIIVFGLICVVLLTERSLIGGAKKSTKYLAEKVHTREPRYTESYEEEEDAERALERRERLREERRERMEQRRREQEERDIRRRKEQEERNLRRQEEQEEKERKRRAEQEERERRRREEQAEKARRKQSLQEAREREKRLLQEEKEDEKILRMNKKSRGVMLDTTLTAKEEPVEEQIDMHEIRVQDVVQEEPVYEEPQRQRPIFRREADNDEVQEISYEDFARSSYGESIGFAEEEPVNNETAYGPRIRIKEPAFTEQETEGFRTAGAGIGAAGTAQAGNMAFGMSEPGNTAFGIAEAENMPFGAAETDHTGFGMSEAGNTGAGNAAFGAAETDHMRFGMSETGSRMSAAEEAERTGHAVTESAFDFREKDLAKMPEPITEFSPAGRSPVLEQGNPEAAAQKQNNVSISLQEKGLPGRPAAPAKKYMFPPVTLLKKGKNTGKGDNNKELKDTALHLQKTLETFGVKVTVTEISQGPTVTRFEMQPEQGVKVSKIVGLADDIKLNLAATDIRIEAPIPGKAAVGIEVPNKENSTVAFRDLIESKEYQEFQSRLAFAVGKDIGGKVVVTDIAKMPHVLIAGATGSGKSVCINTIIMSILYKAHPEDVKLIMIDPKVVELSVYNGIPHLLLPVVTDPKKAAAALHWGVAEMTERYNKFAEHGVRDLKGYNQKAEQMQKKGAEGAPAKMPQIVIIVDELADLMMVAPGEVEESICRLAQLARAAGIHLVIATQRPSVDVITGLIKANMPSRVAFAVSSGVDSRTILDMVGAEKLLGKGDMLFYPQGYPKPARIQGAFISDDEVEDVVNFLKDQEIITQYSPDIEQQMKTVTAAAGGAGGADAASAFDEYFVEAGKFVIEKDKASIGMLQRVFKIGFNRAARIMDQLCDAGVVGEEEGTKPRKVLMSPEQFESFVEESV